MEAVRARQFRFARIRAASGRLNYFIGISPEQYAALKRAAYERGVGFIVLGSRVSGPRSRQQTLHPALACALPLSDNRRTASGTYPGAAGVLIDKTAIKEDGRESVYTSDVTVLLIDKSGRSPAALERTALALERDFRELDTSFPIKFFAAMQGRAFASEAELLSFGVRHLARNLPADRRFTDEELAAGFRELYCTINLPQNRFERGDAVNGAWNAVLTSISFSLALGFHPIVPLVGFSFGFCGRWLARFKAWITQAPADTPLRNAAALAADAVIGIGVMTLIVNPIGGYGIVLSRILGASVLHTLSKGSVRLALDKHFSQRDSSAQRAGVFLAIGINFLQGLATAYIYAGSGWATAVQIAAAAAGLGWVFLPCALRRPRATPVRPVC